nr:DNA methyltransferase [Candidatus Sigynarchaeum springense]
MAPLDFPIIAEAHDAMHVQHKYWSRKPINVVRAHIEASTAPGDIVLDPFCGSGTTVSQGLILGRKVMASDLNHVATYITRNTITRIDVGELLVVFARIKEAIARKIQDLYKTRCPTCLSIDTTETVCVHWKVHHPFKIWYSCSSCSGKKGKKGSRKRENLHKLPDSEDLVLLDKINAMAIPCWYPSVEIPPGIVFNQARRDVSRFDELFTKRNLIALSLLRNQIDLLPEVTSEERAVKEQFLFTFTSMVHLCSKMTPIRPSRPYSSFWATNSYWLPRHFMESNVWEKFESAVLGPQGLIAARRDANKKIPVTTRIVPSFEALASTPAPCTCIIQHDAARLDELVPPDSIDYIFTDPPYAGSIPYLELSTLWSIWLDKGARVGELFDKEILVDPGRGKDIACYCSMLATFFARAFSVLKPGKYLTFTYHNLDIRIRKAILGAVMQAGFELRSIIYQAPPRASPAHTLRPFNSAVGDYIVNLVKPPRLKAEGKEAIAVAKQDEGVTDVEVEIVNLLGNILLDRGEPATFTQILNYLDVQLFSRPWYFQAHVDPLSILKKHVGTCFVHVAESIGSKKGTKWWLEPAFKEKLLKNRGQQEVIPVSRKIERYLHEHENELVSLPQVDIARAVLKVFNGILLPDAKFLEKAIKQLKSKIK